MSWIFVGNVCFRDWEKQQENKEKEEKEQEEKRKG